MVQLARRALNATLAGIALLSLGLVAAGSSRAQHLPAAPKGDSTGLRDSGAEQFVQTHGRKLMSVLGDPSLDEARRAAAYRDAVEQTIDLRAISDFLLGKYSSKISAEQRARFTDAFVGYARRVSAVWLKSYRADRFRIRGSHVNGPGDAIVDIEISGDRVPSPRNVSFRVLGSGEARRIVDVEYNGAWLRAIRRDEFVSTLDKANGDIDVLIARLNELPKA
jgi:ABC-type transporter MlaC component